MPHITFIHGIANKPAKEVLLQNWIEELKEGGLDLGANTVTSSMAYWADVVYASPLESSVAFESVDAELGTDADDADFEWIKSLPDEQLMFSEALIKKFELNLLPPAGDIKAMPDKPMDEERDYSFEAIPLPWFIKERVMKKLLKDTHHYLFNETFSPRPGESFEVQTELRKRFIDQLIADKSEFEGPFIVLSHSMGTVISYDCLKNIANCPSIDGYMTVGSPLGISEIHDNFKPKYSKKDAFPSEKLIGDWVNVYDRLDPVALDNKLANDYMKAGSKVIVDQRVKNSGRWRHSSFKYYGQPKLVEHLSKLLKI